MNKFFKVTQFIMPILIGLTLNACGNDAKNEKPVLSQNAEATSQSESPEEIENRRQQAARNVFNAQRCTEANNRVIVAEHREIFERARCESTLAFTARVAAHEERMAPINASIAAGLDREEAMTARLEVMSNALCFSGETPIRVRDAGLDTHHLVPISSVQVGDEVLSCDPEVSAENCEYRRVEQVMSRHVNHLFILSIGENRLRVTGNHLLFGPYRGWIEAQNLRVGDELQSISGAPVMIENICEEFGAESGGVQVYNLEVQGTHTYYACDVLVHNCHTLQGIADGTIAPTPQILALRERIRQVAAARAAAAQQTPTVSTPPLVDEPQTMIAAPSNVSVQRDPPEMTVASEIDPIP